MMRALACALVSVLAGCASADEPGQGEVKDTTAPFLLVREFDWLNASEEAPQVLGHFGGHCATAHYALEPAVVTIRIGEMPDAPPAIMVRDHRDSPRVEKAVTTSVDRIEHEFDDRFQLATPYSLRNTTIILASVTLEGAAFVLGGETERRIEVGQSAVVPVEYDFELDGHVYHGAHVLELVNVGPAQLRHDPIGMCV